MRSAGFDIKNVFGGAWYEWFQSPYRSSFQPAGCIEWIDGDDVFACAGHIHDNKRSNEVGLDFVRLSPVGQEDKIVDGEVACSGFSIKVFFTDCGRCIKVSFDLLVHL
uniref:Uncharacterized protein n=1 Tax=Romanomermis culicivorax TaxID=13658 RepID=A0A915JJL4_ROMCU